MSNRDCLITATVLQRDVSLIPYTAQTGGLVHHVSACAINCYHLVVERDLHGTTVRFAINSTAFTNREIPSVREGDEVRFTYDSQGNLAMLSVNYDKRKG